MQLIETTPKKKEILQKRGITTKNDLLYFLPRKYNDFTNVYREVMPIMNGLSGCFVGKVEKVEKNQTSNHMTLIKFKLVMQDCSKVTVMLFGQAHKYDYLCSLEKKVVIVAGYLAYHETYGFKIQDPEHIVPEYSLNKVRKVESVYTKIKGISDEYMGTLIDDAINCFEEPYMDEGLKKKYHIDKLPTMREAFYTLHHPDNMDMEKAKQRIVVDVLLKFAVELEVSSREESKGTHIIIKTLKITRDIIANLPYELTTDQKNCFEEMTKQIRDGKRVSALIQGDVGCGKTMIAILMLFLLAENSYQGVLMAPTSILAKQHYEQINELAEKYGIQARYLDGSLTASARKKVLADVANGTCKIIVGTQALTTDSVAYNNLGVVIIDEEHRYGVEQRNVLMKEAAKGVNTILMSATPMPRTLAGSLHGNNTEIFDIRTMPACRKPIQTAINSSDKVIFDFIEKQLAEGRQAYVVCPLIEKGEESSELMKDVLSVEETTKAYKERFEPFYKVASLSGKMKEDETNAILSAFKAGETQILISTTVIEVGVNVPNASVIVISNAERFGLAAMHQLRGRVGRGQYKSYCILKSKDKDNERLKALVTCADGFTIAEEDLKLRGAGELTGIKQSGFTKYMEHVIKYPNLFQIIKKLAIEIVDQL